MGALGSGLATSDEPDAAVDGAGVVLGCGADVTLIVDAGDLEAGAYELRASVGGRMLPMINSMTHPLIGAHRGHQWVVPDQGRLLLVANVPAGTGNPLRYELVRGNSTPDLNGTLQRSCSPRG